VLGVTNHGNGYVTYEYTTFNGMIVVAVKTDKFLTYAVRDTPAVYYQDGIESTALNHLKIAVNLSLGLRIALGVYDNGKTGFGLGTAS